MTKTVELTSRLTHVRTKCVSCGAGDIDTPEEQQMYYEEFNKGKGLAVHHHVVTPDVCAECGCNTLSIQARVEVGLK